MPNAEHHLHIRKRLYKNLEGFPHPNRSKRIIDSLVIIFSIIGPILTFPQFLKVWVERSTEGLSIVTWCTYFVSSCIWFTYGVVHHEKPIIFANSLYMVLNGLIIIGIFLYS